MDDGLRYCVIREKKIGVNDDFTIHRLSADISVLPALRELGSRFLRGGERRNCSGGAERDFRGDGTRDSRGTERDFRGGETRAFRSTERDFRGDGIRDSRGIERDFQDGSTRDLRGRNSERNRRDPCELDVCRPFTEHRYIPVPNRAFLAIEDDNAHISERCRGPYCDLFNA
ncbi:MAG: hypothetical protein LBT20_05665 [Clostridiales bacterium]|nr:hypothetical protein [Clostridiales bacterium]